MLRSFTALSLLARLGSALAIATASQAVAQVTVSVTADNQFLLGTGPRLGPVTLTSPTPTCNIFSCPVIQTSQTFSFTGLSPGDYFYVAAWSDEFVTSGLLAQIRCPSGTGYVRYSGPSWEVYAAGTDIDLVTGCSGGTSTAPSAAMINAAIAAANTASGAAGTSIDWVDVAGGISSAGSGVLAVGEDNSSSIGGNFPQIPCLDTGANWIWYTTDPTYTSIPDPFNTSTPLRDFLVFRKWYCPADFDDNNAVTVQDFFKFLAAYFSGDPAADINCSGSVSIQDIFDFLQVYFAGC